MWKRNGRVFVLPLLAMLILNSACDSDNHNPTDPTALETIIIQNRTSGYTSAGIYINNNFYRRSYPDEDTSFSDHNLEGRTTVVARLYYFDWIILKELYVDVSKEFDIPDGGTVTWTMTYTLGWGPGGSTILF